MGGVGEHIDGGGGEGLVAEGGKALAIAGEGCAVAGDINDSVGRHLCDGVYQRLVAALSRRIKHDNIGLHASFKQSCCRLRCVGADEFGVFNAVEAGVFLCIFNSLRNDFNADQLFDRNY